MNQPTRIILAVDATELCEDQSSRILVSAGVIAQVDHNNGELRWKRVAVMLAAILREQRYKIVPGCAAVNVRMGPTQRTFVCCETSTADGRPALGVLTWIEWTLAHGDVAFEAAIDELPKRAMA